MPVAPELEGLQWFSRESDRDSGRVCVGRTAEIRRIVDASEMWRLAVADGRPPLGVVLVSGADWDRTRREAATLRENGYEARRSLEMKSGAPLVSRFLQTAPLSVMKHDAIAILRHLMDDDATLDMHPQAVLDHFVHQGVLHEPDGDGEYVCPIPSFREFLIRKGGRSEAGSTP